jgi:hypothetical protein
MMGILNTGPVGVVLKSPILTAVLIVSVMMLVVVCVYDKGALIKTAVYVLIPTTAFLFAHNQMLMSECARKTDAAYIGGFEPEAPGLFVPVTLRDIQ